MKNGIALVLLLCSLAVLVKLAAKPAPAVVVVGRRSPGPEGASALVARYATAPAPTRELVARVAERFGRRALVIDQAEGLPGLQLLDRLDLEAVFLQEKRPREFQSLRRLVGDESAANLLTHWREYFGLKRADEVDQAILIEALAALSPAYRQTAARYPSALPLILAEPEGVCDLIEHAGDRGLDPAEILAALALISLDQGPGDLSRGVRIMAQHGPLALRAIRRMGTVGLGLAAQYAEVLEALPESVPLDDALIMARVNGEDLDRYLTTHQPRTAAASFARAVELGLVAEVCGAPGGLRLMIEHGELGERALKHAGADAPLVITAYPEPILERQAARALAEHGSMALVILDKYAHDPDFRAILAVHGPGIVPAIARADMMPQAVAELAARRDRGLPDALALGAVFAAGESGQEVIRTIKRDGLARAVELGDKPVTWDQFLPLYDVAHLAGVVARGSSPTRGESIWALIDGCFVVADALALVAGPEGAVAGQALKGQTKAAATTVAHEAAEGASRQVARLWTVRAAGGIHRLLSRSANALETLDLAAVSAAGNGICSRAGLRLAAWKPIALFRDGVRVVVAIPPGRGLKYLSIQVASTGVGVVGFQKMEEYLASRRPSGVAH